MTQELIRRAMALVGRVPDPTAIARDMMEARAKGGGHVGLSVGEDETAFHVLGGNQADAVSISRIAKSRCIDIRRPIYRDQPASVAPVQLAATGAMSVNEA